MGRFLGRGLLQILSFPFFLAEEMQPKGLARKVQCQNNYGSLDRRVACTWRPQHPVGAGPFYLNFSDPDDSRNEDLLCHLLASTEEQSEFSCSARGDGRFTDLDAYIVTLYGFYQETAVADLVYQAYEPCLHIKCDPPFDLQSTMISDKWKIQWKKPQLCEGFLKEMEWELAWKATQDPWEQAQNRTFVKKETWVEVEGSEFKSGVDYIARIRCKTPDSLQVYMSTWSEWSATTEYSVPPGDQQEWLDSHLLWSGLISIGLCLGALLSLLLGLWFSSRTKDRSCAKVPDPAAFFHPLYTSHNGNFKEWIGLKEWSVGLRSTSTTSPGKDNGDVPPLGLPSHEAISQISFCVCPLPGTPNWQTEVNKYVALEVGQKVPPEAEALFLAGRGSFQQLEGMNVMGAGGCPYLRYKD